MQFMRQCGKIF